MSVSIAHRNAANVLPEPVGAIDERILAPSDSLPCLGLHRRGRPEGIGEPMAHRSGKQLKAASFQACGALALGIYACDGSPPPAQRRTHRSPCSSKAPSIDFSASLRAVSCW